MLWIKRNLFVALGGVVALALLGAGIYYFMGARSANAALDEDIAQTTSTLNKLLQARVRPNAENIALAKEGTAQLQGALANVRKLYTPVEVEEVTGPAFRSYRDNTLAELHRMAKAARTTLPGENYAFSFQTQKTKVEFKEGTFPAIPIQMAEVKELCRILFDARVNPLVNIRRSRVSKDDSESGGTSANDYHSLTTETNGVTGAVTSPYELTFHCLTSELAAVLERLAASSHGFVVKSIQAKPEAELPVAGGLPGLGGAQPRPRTAGRPPTRGRSRARRTTRATAAEGPVVLLKEQRLKVDLLVCVVRALN